MLCDRCRQIEFQSVERFLPEVLLQNLGKTQINIIPSEYSGVSSSGIYRLHASFQDLLRSAAQCDFCQMAAHGLVYQQWLFGERDETGQWQPIDAKNAPIVLSVIIEPFQEYDEAFSELSSIWEPKEARNITISCGERSFFVTMTKIPEILRRFTSSHVDHSESDRGQITADTSTGSAQSMQLIKYWLQECLTNHPNCAEFSGPLSEMPTRVLDVGDTTKQPRLFTSGGLKAKYVALSHCWGPTPLLRTLSSNISVHKQHIALESLPKTFRDAVHICRALDIQYLWIDSLCIIQDSHEDWEAEAATMGDVYQRALFTISAAKSKDGSGGCFVDREARCHRPCQLAMTFPLSNLDQKNEATSCEDDVYIYPFKWSFPVGPLYGRAWVFQEQALSARTLAFVSDTLYWSCVSGTASESQMTCYGVYKQEHSYVAKKSLFGNLQQILSRREAQDGESNKRQYIDKEDIYQVWGDIITEYSRRSITFPSDRLVALSGVASEIKHILDDTYAAGLWSKDVFRGLLWSCKGPRGRKSLPPEVYIAPSWSWASLNDAAITMDFANQIWKEMTDDEESKENVEILDVQCTPSGGNPFGQVSSGTIRLKGYIKKATFAFPENGSTKDPDSSNSLYDPYTGLGIGGLNPDEPLAKTRVGHNVWCLFMAWRNEENEEHATCLALVETGLSLGENEFRRIGIAGIYAEEWFSDVEKSIVLLV